MESKLKAKRGVGRWGEVRGKAKSAGKRAAKSAVPWRALSTSRPKAKKERKKQKPAVFACLGVFGVFGVFGKKADPLSKDHRT